MRKLMLGEGMTSIPEPNKIRIDIVPAWADIVWDLNDGLPKLEGKFDYIEASHVFEHIESARVLKGIMIKLYDLLADGGTFLIEVPYWHSESAVECIEHCHFFNENSFMNFYDNPYAKEMGLPKFKHVSHELVDQHPHKVVKVILSK